MTKTSNSSSEADKIRSHKRNLLAAERIFDDYIEVALNEDYHDPKIKEKLTQLTLEGEGK